MARLLRASFPRLELLEIGEKGFIVTSSLFCPRYFRFDVMELAVVIPFIETVQLRRFLHFARHADDVVVFDPNLIVLLLVRFDELLVLLLLCGLRTLVGGDRLLRGAALLGDWPCLASRCGVSFFLRLGFQGMVRAAGHRDGGLGRVWKLRLLCRAGGRSRLLLDDVFDDLVGNGVSALLQRRVPLPLATQHKPLLLLVTPMSF